MFLMEISCPLVADSVLVLDIPVDTSLYIHFCLNILESLKLNEYRQQRILDDV